jgi:YD repeat-containing protein
MIDKLPAMYFFPADYISGTRTLTMQQRGIYCDLLFFSHTFNGKGLPNNIDELCRMIFPMTFDQDEIEKLRSDLILVLEQKFYVENNRYYNKRQQIEFVRGLELSNKRSEARKKKKFDSVLSNQLHVTLDKDNDNDKDIDKEFNNNIWSKLKVKRGSKKLAFNKWVKIKDSVKNDLLVDKFNNLCQQTSDDIYVPHFATWLNQQRWEDEEVFSIDNFKKTHNITANFLEEKDNLLYFTTKESFGVMDWVYDKQGNMISQKDLNGKKEKETEKTEV